MSAAATFPDPCSGDVDVATCERVDYIAQHVDLTNDGLNNLHDDVFVIVGAVLGASLVGPVLTVLSGRKPR